MPPQFNVSWSLAIEEWFYLLLPFLTLIFSFLLRDSRRALIVTAALLLVIPTTLRMTVGVGQTWDSADRRIVLMRLDAIMWGVLIAVISKQKHAIFAALQKPLAFGIGVMLCSVCSVRLIFRFRSDHFFLASLSDALILTGDMIILRPEVFVGDAVFLAEDSYANHLCNGSWHERLGYDNLHHKVRNNFPHLFPFFALCEKVLRNLKGAFVC